MSAPTSERLASALRDARVPQTMVEAASAGRYDDYRSSSATPIMDLVADLERVGTPQALALAERAKRGDFDATREEAAAWRRSPEGRAAVRDLLG